MILMCTVVASFALRWGLLLLWVKLATQRFPRSFLRVEITFMHEGEHVPTTSSRTLSPELAPLKAAMSPYEMGRRVMQRPGMYDYKPWLACMLRVNL